MISLNISRGTVAAQFQAQLQQARNPRAQLLASGQALAARLQSHFRQKDATEPNRLSPRRKHFWLQVATSVSDPELSGNQQVTVRVSDPRIAHKISGGPIRPRRAQALTIPLSARAYGRSPAEFEAATGLKLYVLSKQGKTSGVLAAKVGDKIEVEYLLTRGVNQAPDPTALPPMGELEKAVQEAQVR